MLFRVRGGETVVSDGPLSDADEQFGGYFLVDCDRETALAYAAEIPAAEGGRSRSDHSSTTLDAIRADETARLESWTSARLPRAWLRGDWSL